MSRLRIGFKGSFGDSAGAVVPVDIIDESLVNMCATTLLAMPFGDGVEVAPGEYLVRAVLPSGEFASTQVKIGPNETATAMLQTPKQSPRENLSWAYHLQGVPKGAGMMAGAERPATAGADSPAGVPQFRLWRHTPAASDRAERWDEVLVTEHGVPGVYSSLSRDLMVRTVDPAVAGTITITWHALPPAARKPLWVQVTLRGRSEIAAIPPAGEMHVLVVDDPQPDDARAFRVMVGGGDPTAQSLLGFLSHGDFASARRVGADWMKKAEDLLQHKRDDPVSAAAAGYFLLKAGELPRLHDWTRNLADWFPWLADGSVIRAWHLAAEDNPDQWMIRRNLLETADRGVPLYTYGLRMLVDGLTVLDKAKRGDDVAVASALARARAYASATEWRSGTTAFQGDHPAFPARRSKAKPERPEGIIVIAGATHTHDATRSGVSIRRRWYNRWRVVEIAGAVDKAASERLKVALRDAQRMSHDVIVDLRRVTSLSTHGVSALALANNEATSTGARLRLVLKRRGPAWRALELPSLLRRFSLHATLDAASYDEYEPPPTLHAT